MSDTTGGPAVEIPQYRCHKVVRAAKITAVNPDHENEQGARLMLGDIGGMVDVDLQWLGRHGALNMVGGYYVVYEDGYTSFSPTKAFEEGYALIPRSHQDRVVREKSELDERLTKLRAFCGGGVFDGLSTQEKQRLTRQEQHMTDLSEVLRERIAAF